LTFLHSRPALSYDQLGEGFRSGLGYKRQARNRYGAFRDEQASAYLIAPLGILGETYFGLAPKMPKMVANAFHRSLELGGNEHP
jgi:hypothetical protein